jgi:hypothetical protein
VTSVISSARYAEYQQHADEAIQMALTAVTDNYRVWWLELAQSWLEMIPPDQIKQLGPKQSPMADGPSR